MIEGCHWMDVESATALVPTNGIGGSGTQVNAGHCARFQYVTIVAIEVYAVDAVDRVATILQSDKLTPIVQLTIPAVTTPLPKLIPFGVRGIRVLGRSAFNVVNGGFSATTEDPAMKFRIYYRRV